MQALHVAILEPRDSGTSAKNGGTCPMEHFLLILKLSFTHIRLLGWGTILDQGLLSTQRQLGLTEACPTLAT